MKGSPEKRVPQRASDGQGFRPADLGQHFDRRGADVLFGFPLEQVAQQSVGLFVGQPACELAAQQADIGVAVGEQGRQVGPAGLRHCPQRIDGAGAQIGVVRPEMRHHDRSAFRARQARQPGEDRLAHTWIAFAPQGSGEQREPVGPFGSGAHGRPALLARAFAKRWGRCGGGTLR